METEISFEIENLSVTANGKTLLAVERLAVPHGCHTAVIGSNGAGKSTLLRALIGQTGKGRVSLFGKAVPPQLQQGKVAWVAQHGRYQMPLTVREFVALGQQSGSWPFQAAALPPEADDLLDYFDLAALAGKRIQTLSGGEQQRANIVRALLQKAPVLLLDEPCNHLDIRHQHSLMEYLNRNGRTFSAVMVLHDLNLAAQYAQHIVLLDKGRVAAQGSPESVMQPERLQDIYQWPLRRLRKNGRLYFIVG